MFPVIVLAGQSQQLWCMADICSARMGRPASPPRPRSRLLGLAAFRDLPYELRLHVPDSAPDLLDLSLQLRVGDEPADLWQGWPVAWRRWAG